MWESKAGGLTNLFRRPTDEVAVSAAGFGGAQGTGTESEKPADGRVSQEFRTSRSNGVEAYTRSALFGM